MKGMEVSAYEKLSLLGILSRIRKDHELYTEVLALEQDYNNPTDLDDTVSSINYLYNKKAGGTFAITETDETIYN